MSWLFPRMAQSEEFDVYKIRIDGFWAYSNPSGSVQGSADNGTVDLQKDLGFNSYSTLAAKIDWKFTHKNHFYFVVSSVRHIPSDGTGSNHRLPGANVHRWLNDPQQPPVEISMLPAISTTLSGENAGISDSPCRSTCSMPRPR